MFCAENEKVTFYPRQTPVLYYGGSLRGTRDIQTTYLTSFYAKGESLFLFVILGNHIEFGFLKVFINQKVNNFRPLGHFSRLCRNVNCGSFNLKVAIIADPYAFSGHSSSCHFFCIVLEYSMFTNVHIYSCAHLFCHLYFLQLCKRAQMEGLMNIIYFHFIDGYGINANIGTDWDFFRSFDELVKECLFHFHENFVLAPTTATSGDFIGYREVCSE